MPTEKQYKIRLDTFNFAKGLLIILIVVGHKIFYYDDSVTDLYFGIAPIMIFFRHGANPAFYMIAGFGFRAMKGKKCLTKTFKDLVVPYLYVMVAYAICFPLFHYMTFRWWPGAIHETIRFVLAFLLGLPEGGKEFLGYQLYECSVVWFLLSLFIALNLLNLLLKIKEKRWQYVVVGACLFLGYILAQKDFDYYCIPQGLMGAAYCYIGFLINQHKIYASERLPIICIVLAVLSGIQGVWGEFHMGYGIFDHGFIECIIAGCSGALILLLSIILGNKKWRILDSIKKVGVYTYWIMCIHAVEMSCIPWYYWSNCMKDHQILAYLIEVAITTVLLFISCTMIKRFVIWRYRRKIKLTAGKR